MPNGWLALSLAMLAALLAVSLRSVGAIGVARTDDLVYARHRDGGNRLNHRCALGCPARHSARTIVNTVQDSAALALLGTLLLSLAARIAGTPETDRNPPGRRVALTSTLACRCRVWNRQRPGLVDSVSASIVPGIARGVPLNDVGPPLGDAEKRR